MKLLKQIEKIAGNFSVKFCLAVRRFNDETRVLKALAEFERLDLDQLRRQTELSLARTRGAVDRLRSVGSISLVLQN